MMAQYCKMKGIQMSNLLKPPYMEKIMSRYGFRDWDSVLASIGHGGLKEGQVVNKLLDEYEKTAQKRDHRREDY